MSASLGKRSLDYFDLRSPAHSSHGDWRAPGPATQWDWRRELWPLVVYGAGVVGVIAKQWFDAHQRGQLFDLSPSTFLLAVVVSAVTYPATYHSLQAQSNTGLQLFLALQNGFFWQTVLGQIMR